MAVSVRVPYAWRCERCGRQRQAPIWRIIDGRERPDVLAGRGHGVAVVDCAFCGAVAHIDAPLLVLRPGVTAPLLLGVSITELQDGVPRSAAALLEEAGQAGAFAGSDFGVWQTMPLPRRLLPVVLARNLDEDLEDPQVASRQLQTQGQPTVDDYATFLSYLAQERETVSVKELLRAMWTSLPAELTKLVREHPELTGSTRVRDVGREDLHAHAGTPVEYLLSARQRLLDELCDGHTPQSAAIERYFESMNHFGGDLRSRLFAMHERVRNTPGTERIPLAREALALAADLGEEQVETEVAAMLGESLVTAVRAGFDADALEEALYVLGLALSRLPEGSLPWVSVANNLANAHSLRDDGDRLEVWEAARDLLARATALNRREHPEIWARLQMNLGLLLAERPGGGPEDLSLGIDHMRAGLKERSPERNPVDWAYSMLNLGLLLFRRAAPGDLHEAERCYRGALRHLRADDEPLLWGQLQCNLGDLLLSREPADAKGARRAAVAALELSAMRPGLFDTSRISWLLARASDRLDGPNNSESIQLRREALASAPPLASPPLHLRIAGELFAALASANRWPEAADVASGMITAMDALYDAQVTVAGRRSVLAQWPRLARWTAFALAQAGRPERAVEAIERGLARQLSVVAGREAADLQSLERFDPLLARRYRLEQTRYRSSLPEPSATTADGLTAGAVDQAGAERGLRAVIDEIRVIPGLERFLHTATLADIVQAVDGKPLAYLVNAPWGSYVLAIPRRPVGHERDSPVVRAIPVPEVTSVSILHLLLVSPEGGGTPGLILAQAGGRLRRRRHISAALDRLNVLTPLLRPVAELVADDPSHEAVIIPTGLLGMAPLHAVPLSPTSGEILDDTGTLYFAPSAAVHAASRSKAAREPTSAPSLVAVTDPDGSLPGSRSEVAEILTLFQPFAQVSNTTGSQATVGWLLDHLPEASYLHLACHGSADQMAGGSLTLADGQIDLDTLTRHQLPSCRLTVASACQSSHYSTRENPDEFLGLAAGFLQAGAACAVASLWQVDDLATAVLMTRFYELLSPAQGSDRVAPVPALRTSRAWLRRLTWDELTRYGASHPHLAALIKLHAANAAKNRVADIPPFASPFHWAAFTAWGV